MRAASNSVIKPVGDMSIDEELLKCAQTTCSATNLRSTKHRRLRKIKSEEDCGNEEILNEIIYSYQEMHGRKEDNWREKLEKLARKPMLREEKMKKKLKKCLTILSSQLSEFDEDTKKFKSDLTQIIIKKLTKMCLRADIHRSASPVMIYRVEVPKYVVHENIDELKAVIENWLNIVPIKLRNSQGNYTEQKEIVQNFIKKIKPVISNKYKDKKSYWYTLKKQIIKVLEELPVMTERKNKHICMSRYANILVHDILNMSNSKYKTEDSEKIETVEASTSSKKSEVIETKYDKLLRFVREEMFKFLRRVNLNYSEENKNAVDYMVRILNAVASDGNDLNNVDDDLRNVLQNIGKWPFNQANYFVNMFMRHYNEFLKANSTNEEENKNDQNVFCIPYGHTTSVYTNFNTCNNNQTIHVDHIYKKQLKQIVVDWIISINCQIPMIFEINFVNIAVLDLVENIINYTSQNLQVKDENFEQYLKFQIFKWIRYTLGGDSKLMESSNELISEILSFTTPKLRNDVMVYQTQQINSKKTDEAINRNTSVPYEERLLEVTFDWLHDLPADMHSSQDATLETQLIKNLASNIAKGLATNTDRDNMIDKEVDDWVKKALLAKPNDSIINVLKINIKNLSANANITIEYQLEKSIIRRYEDIVDDWLDTVPLHPGKQFDFVQMRIDLIHELAMKIYKVKNKGLSDSNEIKIQKLEDNISDWIKHIPIHPRVDRKSFRDNYARKLIKGIQECNIDETAMEMEKMSDFEWNLNLIEGAALDWLKESTLYRNSKTEAKKKQEQNMNDFAKEYTSMLVFGGDASTVIKKYVEILCQDITTNKAFIENTSNQLQSHLNNNLAPNLSKTIEPYTDTRKEPPQSTDIIRSAIFNWSSTLPLKQDYCPSVFKSLIDEMAKEITSLIVHPEHSLAEDNAEQIKQKIFEYLSKFPLRPEIKVEQICDMISELWAILKDINLYRDDNVPANMTLNRNTEVKSNSLSNNDVVNLSSCNSAKIKSEQRSKIFSPSDPGGSLTENIQRDKDKRLSAPAKLGNENLVKDIPRGMPVITGPFNKPQLKETEENANFGPQKPGSSFKETYPYEKERRLSSPADLSTKQNEQYQDIFGPSGSGGSFRENTQREQDKRLSAPANLGNENISKDILQGVPVRTAFANKPHLNKTNENSNFGPQGPGSSFKETNSKENERRISSPASLSTGQNEQHPDIFGPSGPGGSFRENTQREKDKWLSAPDNLDNENIQEGLPKGMPVITGPFNKPQLNKAKENTNIGAQGPGGSFKETNSKEKERRISFPATLSTGQNEQYPDILGPSETGSKFRENTQREKDKRLSAPANLGDENISKDTPQGVSVRTASNSKPKLNKPNENANFGPQGPGGSFKESNSKENERRISSSASLLTGENEQHPYIFGPSGPEGRFRENTQKEKDKWLSTPDNLDNENIQKVLPKGMPVITGPFNKLQLNKTIENINIGTQGPGGSFKETYSKEKERRISSPATLSTGQNEQHPDIFGSSGPGGSFRENKQREKDKRLSAPDNLYNENISEDLPKGMPVITGPFTKPQLNKTIENANIGPGGSLSKNSKENERSLSSPAALSFGKTKNDEPIDPELADLRGMDRQQLYEHFYKIFIAYSQEIPLNTFTPENKQLADISRQLFINGIWKAIFALLAELEIDGDYSYFKYLMEGRLYQILDVILPNSEEASRFKTDLVNRLVNDVIRMVKYLHHILDPEIVKHGIIQSLNRKIQGQHNNEYQDWTRHLLIQDIINEHLLYINYKETDPIKANVYKKRLMKLINELINYINTQSQTSNQVINEKAMRNYIHETLRGMPALGGEILKDEVDEILIAQDIQQWYNNLPVNPLNIDHEDEYKRKRCDVLAHKIHEIEKRRLEANDSSCNRDIKHEISKFLDNINTNLKENEDLNMNNMIEELANKLKTRRDNNAVAYEDLSREKLAYSTLAQIDPEDVFSENTNQKTIGPVLPQGINQSMRDNMSSCVQNQREILSTSQVACHHSPTPGRSVYVDQEPVQNQSQLVPNLPQMNQSQKYNTVQSNSIRQTLNQSLGQHFLQIPNQSMVQQSQYQNLVNESLGQQSIAQIPNQSLLQQSISQNLPQIPNQSLGNQSSMQNFPTTLNQSPGQQPQAQYLSQIPNQSIQQHVSQIINQSRNQDNTFQSLGQLSNTLPGQVPLQNEIPLQPSQYLRPETSDQGSQPVQGPSSRATASTARVTTEQRGIDAQVQEEIDREEERYRCRCLQRLWRCRRRFRLPCYPMPFPCRYFY